MGCGAALLNPRLALEHHGVRPVVTLLPRMSEPSLLAQVRADSAVTPSSGVEELAQAISKRCSNRRPFRETPVPTRSRHQLVSAVREEGCWLHLVERSE